MKNELDVVKDLSARFECAGIAFMLSGSMAMNYYAVPRMTRDIDVVIVLGASDVDKLVHCFNDDYYISPEDVRDAVNRETIFNMIHNESLIKIDCIIRKSEEYRVLEFERRQKIAILDFTTYIASKEDLIISKLVWAKDSHSEMQMRDIRNLLSASYDGPYLQRWISRLNLTGVFEQALHE